MVSRRRLLFDLTVRQARKVEKFSRAHHCWIHVVRSIFDHRYSFKGKGHAEMAVSRFRSIQSGITTPESIPTTPMSSSFDEESVRDTSSFIDRNPFFSFYSGINVVHWIVFPSVDGSHRPRDNNKSSRMSQHQKLNQPIFDKVY